MVHLRIRITNFVTDTVRLRISVSNFVTYIDDIREDEKEDVSSYWMTLRKRRRYWKLKGRSLWRTRFVRGYGPVVRQTT
jgi:hypothetical protein